MDALARYLLLFVMLASSLAAGTAKALDPNEEVTIPDAEEDFLVYAVTWQPTFCVMKPNTPGCDQAPQQFLTHGIWRYTKSNETYTNRHPQYCGCSPEKREANIACDVSAENMQAILSNKKLLELVTDQPERLFKHEWEKHGTCYGKDQRGYFDDYVRLRSVVTFEKDKFHKLVGKTSKFSTIRKLFPNNTAFRCYRSPDGQQYLHEVFYLIDLVDITKPYKAVPPVEIGLQCLEQPTLIPPGVEGRRASR